jgi:hypothetical protein
MRVALRQAQGDRRSGSCEAERGVLFFEMNYFNAFR